MLLKSQREMSHWMATKITVALKLFSVTCTKAMEKVRISDIKGLWVKSASFQNKITVFEIKVLKITKYIYAHTKINYKYLKPHFAKLSESPEQC